MRYSGKLSTFWGVLLISTASLEALELRHRYSVDGSVAFAHQTVPAERAPGLRESQQSLPFLLAQATAAEQADERSHHEALDVMLARDDFASATSFVEGLARSEALSMSTIQVMRDRIRRSKVERLVQYSKQLRESMASSDLQAMRANRERIRQLTMPAQESLTAGIENERQQAPATSPIDRDKQTSLKRDEGATSVPRDDDVLIEQMHQALRDGHLFSPPETNAFDLAAARLAETPSDPDARDVLRKVVNQQRGRAQSYLEIDQPILALRHVNQLQTSLEARDIGDIWTSSDRSSASSWADTFKPDIWASLIRKTEAAIDQGRLTVAPEGQISAQGYLEALSSEIGEDHDEVERLAGDIVVRYRSLIDQRLQDQRYDDASRIYDRMDTLAGRFGLLADPGGALRLELGTLDQRQNKHRQLMLQAARWRDRGQLLEPAGANAIETLTEAINLSFDSAEATAVLDEVINDKRQQINDMIEEGRLRDASSSLAGLGAAITSIDGRFATQAAAYSTEARRLNQRANLEDTEARQSDEQRGDVALAPPVGEQDSRAEPLIFVSPF
ncbi:MAG: hypothetical protein AAGA73_09525 [Pseudomonadota bacterium]